MAVIRSGSHACPGEGLGYLRRSKQWLSHEGQATSSRLQMIEPVANLCVTIQRLKRQPEEALHKSRYVVIHEGGWQIRNAHRRVAATFPTKAQALCAAIELAKGTVGTVKRLKFLSGMRTIVSSRSGSTGTICIRTMRRVRLARNNLAAVAPRRQWGTYGQGR
jgi:hypothetical protein